MSPPPQSGDRRARADAAFDWCLRNAAQMESGGNAEQAAEWAMIASSAATASGHRYLCSEPLEALLARLGARVAGVPRAVARAGGQRPQRWLHVLTWSYDIGGHTAIVRRWIERKPPSERHDVVLTFQDLKRVPANLALCVEQSGGRIFSLNGEKTILGRARRLRDMAAESADAVVLYVHSTDIVPALAFAAAGGPPVLLLNHADHQFWVGAAAADLVIDIRDSGLHLTRALRGVTRSALLPVPLPDPGRAAPDRAAASRLRDPAALGHRLVLLTIGSESKYLPQPGLDFPEAALSIIRQVPEAALIAVGPRPESPIWKALHAAGGERIVAVGPDPELGAWHAAADVYLEGYPRGSYTALLEAALAGRAFVRKPYLAPPAELPIDRGALAAFDPPPTLADYVSAAVELCRNPSRRESLAERARAAVLAVHCGAAWDAALESLVRQIPDRHEPSALSGVAPLPPGLAKYWEGYYERGPLDPFEPLVKHAAIRRLTALPLPKVTAGGAVPPGA